MLRRLPLLVFPLLLLVSGCRNDCDQSCIAEADLIERCLEPWGTTWSELSYADGRDEFLDRCYGVRGDTLDELDDESEEFDALLDECRTRRRLADSDTDCETLLE